MKSKIQVRLLIEDELVKVTCKCCNKGPPCISTIWIAGPVGPPQSLPHWWTESIYLSCRGTGSNGNWSPKGAEPEHSIPFLKMYQPLRSSSCHGAGGRKQRGAKQILPLLLSPTQWNTYLKIVVYNHITPWIHYKVINFTYQMHKLHGTWIESS